MRTIEFEQFKMIDLIAGIIIDAKLFPKAKNPSYKIFADFGLKYGILQSSAQVTDLYDINSLINKRIIGCLNLGEKNIAGFNSQFLLLGFPDAAGKIILATWDEFTSVVGSKLC